MPRTVEAMAAAMHAGGALVDTGQVVDELRAVHWASTVLRFFPSRRRIHAPSSSTGGYSEQSPSCLGLDVAPRLNFNSADARLETYTLRSSGFILPLL